jgi:hypothetical protein
MGRPTTPTRNYRLPKGTLDNLQLLIDAKIVRNATEGIIVAVEHLVAEYGLRKKLQQKEDVTIHEGKNQSYKT